MVAYFYQRRQTPGQRAFHMTQDEETTDEESWCLCKTVYAGTPYLPGDLPECGMDDMEIVEEWLSRRGRRCIFGFRFGEKSTAS